MKHHRVKALLCLICISVVLLPSITSAIPDSDQSLYKILMGYRKSDVWDIWLADSISYRWKYVDVDDADTTYAACSALVFRCSVAGSLRTYGDADHWVDVDWRTFDAGDELVLPIRCEWIHVETTNGHIRAEAYRE